jgi:hypothetical protein
MADFQWRRFLEEWSAEISDKAKAGAGIPANLIGEGWLGLPGASPAQIWEAENRLRLKLPPSYRQFLIVANGWRFTTPLVGMLLSVERVEPFHLKYPSWVAAYLPNPYVPSAPEPTDDEYFAYGDEQLPPNIRVEYLPRCLAISEDRDGALYLLNPVVQTADGEWEAWLFADWLAGANRYRSFQDLMIAERASFQRLTRGLQ